jgi:hypothetical protein
LRNTILEQCYPLEIEWKQRTCFHSLGINKKVETFPVPVTHICIPSYLGGWDQENHSSRPTCAIVWETSSPE